jgi:hypothetical protein
MKNKILLVMFCALLYGCGGGGGSGGGSNIPPAVTLAPSNISGTYFFEDTVQFSITATANANYALSGNVYAEIVDNIGVITPNATVAVDTYGRYVAKLTTSPSLALGTHVGNLELRMCRDLACTSQFPGSPVLLPYNITIVATSKPTLTPLVGVGAWETYQGNAQHTGYIPASFDAVKFSPRWRWTTPDIGASLQPVVAANGSVYVTTGYSSASPKLYALNSNDTSQQWLVDFTGETAITQSVTSAGKVFATTFGNSIWSFDAATGSQISKNFISGPSPPTLIVDNGISYTFPYCSTYLGCLPSIDSNYFYVAPRANGGIEVISRASGTLAFLIADTYYGTDYTPVVGSNNNVISLRRSISPGPNYLVNYNITNQNINWATSGNFSDYNGLAVANSVIYVLNQIPSQLEARSELTGTLLWTWTPTDAEGYGFYGAPIITNNLAFVSTTKRVYAISLATHLPVWSYDKPGYTAISPEGLLYVATIFQNYSDGGLDAFNLK